VRSTRREPHHHLLPRVIHDNKSSYTMQVVPTHIIHSHAYTYTYAMHSASCMQCVQRDASPIITCSLELSMITSHPIRFRLYPLTLFIRMRIRIRMQCIQHHACSAFNATRPNRSSLRRDFPAHTHTRSQKLLPMPQTAAAFGPWTIRAREQIFYASRHCFGLVNLKPVLPGHVLVIPKRCVCVAASYEVNAAGPHHKSHTKCPRRVVKRAADLTDDEAADLFLTTRLISGRMETLYGATSLTLTLQDGPDAGQTVPHVHFHILPRTAGDWINNDDVYGEIKRSERDMAEGARRVMALRCDMGRRSNQPQHTAHVDNDKRVARSTDDMAAEVARLRPLFPESLDIWGSEP
jgi:bis(5'-adenosyl)-triphosphatase